MTDQEGAAMTPDIVTEARRLLDAATPGPWYCFTDDSAGKDSLYLMSEYDDGSWVEGKQGPFPLDPFTYDPTPMERATAHFIAAAPRLVTELVAEVERLREKLDQRTDPEPAVCPTCGSDDRAVRRPGCRNLQWELDVDPWHWGAE